MFLLIVLPVAILSDVAVVCVHLVSLCLMIVVKYGGSSKRYCLQAVKQSVLTSHAPIQHVWAIRPCGLAGWLALLLIKSGPTTTHKQVWMCDTYPRQIHVRKQISIRCNRTEYCVHQRWAGIHLAQNTCIWTFNIHN